MPIYDFDTDSFYVSSSIAIQAKPRILELHKWRTTKRGNQTVLARKSSKIEIPVNWLKAAAETYNISPDYRDYVVAEVPLVTVNVPNRNLDCFPSEEMARFDNILGCLVYKTFIGKACFQDHDNKDPLKAKGVNFDSVMVRQKDPNNQEVWKVRVLSGFDRTKDPELAKSIEAGERRNYSMGALVGMSRCSICQGITRGRVASNNQRCSCTGAKKGSIISVEGRSRLKYDLCYGVNFIENSSVGVPADHTAESDEWWA